MKAKGIWKVTNKGKSGFFYGYVMVTSGFFIMAIVWGANRTFGVFLEPMLREFGWTRAGTSGAFTLVMVLMGCTGALAGRMTDRIGPKAVVISCGIFLGAGYLLISLVETIWQFYLYYGVLTGVGMGVSTPLMSIVPRWFFKRRALMASIVTAGPAFGNMAMPLIFSVLITAYGWRVSYFMLGSITLASVCGGALVLKKDPSELGQTAHGANEADRCGSVGRQEGLSFRDAFHTIQFWLLCFLFFCDFFLMNVVTVHIVIHAEDLGFSPTDAASVLSLAAGVCIVARVLIGAVADTIGIKPVFIACFGMAVIAFLLLLFAKSLWMLYLFAGIFGFGLWSSGGLIVPLTADLFGLRSYGAIYGSVFLTGAIGGAFGPVLIGYLFDISGSYTLSFMVCLSISILGVGALAVLKPVVKDAM